ncbi:hypothetical protein LTR37_001495 [Vermiconidia calcicola]|uniref:Uncharacterized protein n=1 Tax=Vermiconidia calcicola TaxID=1690605 RepID=A0ACC3NVP3_9PEZI|nr:hypothetical protein LTR37_001495 [Vermiconidia calcicola]
MASDSITDPLSATQQILRDHNPNTLPALRFSNGDVVIKLGESPSDWLLVHKSIVQVGMPLLAPTLKPEWAKPDIVEHPITGEEVKVHTSAIKFVEDDNTFLLEGKEVVLPVTEYGYRDIKAFANSELSSGGWPYGTSFTWDERRLQDSTRPLKLLITLLYGFPISLKALYPGLEEDKPYPVDLTGATILICNTCAYAEYYGCLN